MKKIKFLFVLCLFSLISIGASAEETCPADEIWYTSTDGNIVTPYSPSAFGANIVSNTYSNGKGIIKFDGNVTSIGSPAFSNCSSLASVDLSACKSIGERAFWGCSSLASIDLSACTSIGSYAFSNCSSLASVDLSACKSIGERAFWGCSSLTSIGDLSACKSIYDYAFDECRTLKTITINKTTPPALNSTNAFNNCPVTFLVPADAVETYKTATNWSSYATQILSKDTKTDWDVNVTVQETASGLENAIGNENLNNVISLKVTGKINAYDIFTMRNNMTNLHILDLTNATIVATANGYTYYNTYTTKDSVVGDYTFYQQKKLMDVKLPSSTKAIGEWAFSGCSSLASVGDLSACTSIGDYAFRNCSSLASIGDLSACQKIGDSAFQSCKSLASVGNLSACTSIGSLAFYECSKLASVGDLSACTSIGHDAFSSCTSLASVDLSACKSIGERAFWGCSSLASIDLSACTYIGKYAFSGCSSLASVGDLSACISIEWGAFSGCTSLASIGDLSACKSIEYNAFYGCSSLASIKLGKSVSSIGQRAFYNCTKLAEIYSYNSTPPTITNETDMFSSETLNNAKLHVPVGCKSAYSSASGWRMFNEDNIIEDALIKATSISLDASSISIIIGNKETLTANILPEDVSLKNANWTSSNESVATVSSKGVVTAISVGTAIITATTTDGTELSASCAVSVKNGNTDVSKYDNAIYIKNQSVFTNSQVTIPIYMKNNVDMTAFSFNLVLPEGMTIAKNDKGKNLLTLNGDRAADDHSLSSNVLEDGSISVACLSLSSETFEGKDGVIINATVNVSADMQEGDHYVMIKNARMATPDNIEYKVEIFNTSITVKSYIPGDVNNDGELSIVDAVGIVNFIIKADTDGLNQKAADANQDGEISIVDAVFVVNKVIHANAKSDMIDMDEMSPSFLSLTDKNIGNAETFEMPVVLNGKAYDITAMQGNIVLPEGITLEGISADENHVVSYNTMDDGTIRMACLSLDNSVFSGNGDVALTLKLRRDASFVSGEMSIESTELVTPSLSTTRPNAAKARLTTGGATSIDGISTGNAETNRYDLSGRKINKSLNGVYIENGKKFINK